MRYLLLSLLIFTPAYAGDTPAFTKTVPPPHLTVTDGDTITLDGRKIRLWGIDAPEMKQTCTKEGKEYPCGRYARRVLELAITGTQIECRFINRDYYRREVSLCTADGVDMGKIMVQKGWALDYPKYSQGHYQSDQEAASALTLGLWKGEFTLPWEWRAGLRPQSNPGR